jgi:hypothetical protein
VHILLNAQAFNKFYKSYFIMTNAYSNHRPTCFGNELLNVRVKTKSYISFVRIVSIYNINQFSVMMSSYRNYIQFLAVVTNFVYISIQTKQMENYSRNLCVLQRHFLLNIKSS